MGGGALRQGEPVEQAAGARLSAAGASPQMEAALGHVTQGPIWELEAVRADSEDRPLGNP